ncbi:hypothetical protein GCM10022286_13050 [Gryllotalpicola daejeonensis]|uniref:Major facilitator superfamily (MFS) profile domain-containing protein n=1 Tax=Gryllotalpicola daejeonensis TaxID=993087 RepID=A0ABP7ZIA9_9MICO
MSDAYQFRTLDRSADTDVIDRAEPRPTELFRPTPQWIPSGASGAEAREKAEPATRRDTVARREAIAHRQATEFGRIRWGSAFFGWVAASGVAVLLAAAVGAVAAAIGLAFNGGSAGAASRAASGDAAVVGLAGAIGLGAILFVAYVSGGYVAGRMARFAGVKQGFAVWLWAVAFAIVGAAVAYLAGAVDPLGFAQQLPGVSDDRSAVALGGVIGALAVAALTALGALLGGRLGMRYHRRVDVAGIDD